MSLTEDLIRLSQECVAEGKSQKVRETQGRVQLLCDQDPDAFIVAFRELVSLNREVATHISALLRDESPIPKRDQPQSTPSTPTASPQQIAANILGILQNAPSMQDFMPDDTVADDAIEELDDEQMAAMEPSLEADQQVEDLLAEHRNLVPYILAILFEQDYDRYVQVFIINKGISS